jgi:uncharacterized repeat protein (TIGR03803 family)
VAGVIMDSAGDLYGTNYGALNYGNPSGYPASYCFTQENPGGSTAGTVFELVYSRDPATGQATYTEKILHSFCAVLACADGANPAAGLIMDAAGNLYGTTQNGGTYNGGTVFELVNSSGTYSLKVLYSFGGAGDGAFPAAGLITDAAGNLYGTTQSGGAYSYGTVFELLAQSISAAGAPQATSVEKVLYSFGGVLGGTAGDGNYPVAGVIMDSAGNLYGTTPNGGAYGGGTVFELIYSSGAYSEKILYSFTGPVGVYSGLLGDGANPVGALIMDAAGSLYGTTQNGGTYGNNGGTVFELIYYKGTYHEVILHSFTGADGDGLYPSAGLTMDSGGNLYGTTRNGGLYGAPLGFGTVFELVYSSPADYAERTLWSFTNSFGDGEYPVAAVAVVAAGNVFSGIYGTTEYGGTGQPNLYGNPFGYGTVFKIPVPTLGPPSGSSCSGIYYPAGPLGPIEVLPSTHCEIIGGQINGNVQMKGGTLTLINTRVLGDIQVAGESTFAISDSTIIEGNLQVQNTSLSSVPDVVCGATVNGNLQFQNSATSVEIGSSTLCPGNKVGGNLQVQNNSGAVQIVDLTVTGNLTVQNNTASAQINGNTVGGNLQVQNNGASTQINGNTVAGNLQVQNDTGSTQVSNNEVTNNLQCQNNTSITGGGNTAGQKRGQCSTF